MEAEVMVYMRISNGGIDNPGGSVGSLSGAAPDAGASALSSAAKTDSVTLANAAGLVALAKATAALRQSKVESLTSQVKSGSYQSDNAQVSHAVVEDHITR